MEIQYGEVAQDKNEKSRAPSQNSFSQIGNQFMEALLRSPLHGLLSRNIALITVNGRNSGKSYTTPVNYTRDGDVLHISSQRNRTWWRNLRGGAAMGLRLQGRDARGWGTVVENDREVGEGLSAYLLKAPQYANILPSRLMRTDSRRARTSRARRRRG